MKTKLTLPYPPSANRMWRRSGHTIYLTAEGRAYKEAVSLLAKQQGCVKIGGLVSLTMAVYRPRKSGDLDNRIKLVLDGLKDVAFGDDKEIIELHAYRFDDRNNPRVEIRIESAIQLADKLF